MEKGTVDCKLLKQKNHRRLTPETKTKIEHRAQIQAGRVGFADAPSRAEQGALPSSCLSVEKDSGGECALLCAIALEKIYLSLVSARFSPFSSFFSLRIPT